MECEWDWVKLSNGAIFSALDLPHFKVSTTDTVARPAYLRQLITVLFWLFWMEFSVCVCVCVCVCDNGAVSRCMSTQRIASSVTAGACPTRLIMRFKARPVVIVRCNLSSCRLASATSARPLRCHHSRH